MQPRPPYDQSPPWSPMHHPPPVLGAPPYPYAGCPRCACWPPLPLIPPWWLSMAPPRPPAPFFSPPLPPRLPPIRITVTTQPAGEIVNVVTKRPIAIRRPDEEPNASAAETKRTASNCQLNARAKDLKSKKSLRASAAAFSPPSSITSPTASSAPSDELPTPSHEDNGDFCDSVANDYQLDLPAPVKIGFPPVKAPRSSIAELLNDDDLEF